MGQVLCTCGRLTAYGNGQCSACRDRQQQKRQSRQSKNQEDRSSHTPPPETISTARKETCAAVSAALEHAFASEDEQPALFPPTFYRTPTRSRSRPKTSPSRSSSSSTTTPSTPERKHTGDQIRSMSGNLDAPERSYSPMSAGFARLNRREAQSDPLPGSEWRGRPGNSRGTLDLDARMFSGVT